MTRSFFLGLFISDPKEENVLFLEWHSSLEHESAPPQPHQRPHRREPPTPLPPSLKKQRRVLILDVEGLLLNSFEMQHDDILPSWTKYMRIVKDKDEVYYLVRPDGEAFLDFCFECFEIWIWSSYKTTKAQHIMETCFPRHYQKIEVFMGNKECQNSNIMMGYKRVYHKNLSLVWKVFDDLDASNTLIFDDTPYRVMWNMRGTYLIFPKMYRQTPQQLQSFLEGTIIPWLLGWLYAKSKRTYTRNTIVNNIHDIIDPETKYVMDVYLSRRKY